MQDVEFLQKHVVMIWAIKKGDWVLYDTFKWSFKRLAIALSCDASCLEIKEEGCECLCQFRICSDFNTSI